MRLGSVDRTYEDDEEDMTWVEYQWLARTNHESPRMVRVGYERPLRRVSFSIRLLIGHCCIIFYRSRIVVSLVFAPRSRDHRIRVPPPLSL